LVSLDEFSTDELAMARIFNGQQLQEAGPSIFATYSKLNEYDPNSFQDILAGKSYLFWVVEKQDQQIPKMEDVKDNIIKFWKRQKAFEAAKIDAEKIAEKANAEKKSLLDTYGEKAVRTGEFSWFSTAGQFGISDVIGVDGPGESFMKKAFSLNEGEAGAAPNMNRDVIYVIRITNKKKTSPEDVNRTFIEKVAQAQDIPLEVQTVTGSYVNRLSLDWQQDFREEFEIRWVGR
jgi:hypothetical protein